MQKLNLLENVYPKNHNIWDLSSQGDKFSLENPMKVWLVRHRNTFFSSPC